MGIFQFFAAAFCFFTFLFSSVTTWMFMLFLSSPNKNHHEEYTTNRAFCLWLDGCLILTFMLQHSYFKTADIASYLSKLRLNPHYARCAYNLLTSATLQAVMKFWTPVSSFTLWEMNTENIFVWGLLVAVQVVAWGLIYGGALLMDLPELLGVKQVYYYYINVSTVSDMKSKELQRLYDHKRHPSFLGFIAILWCTPIMSLDRILLAVLITLYAALTWEPTMDDTRYHQRQLLQKQQEIEYTQRRNRQQQAEFRNYRG